MPQKNIFITGCGPNGIGGALAREFQQRGHRVFASGLSEPLLRTGGFAELGMDTVVMDVTSQASIDAAVARVRAALTTTATTTSTSTGDDGSKPPPPQLHMLVNNAGVMHVAPFADTTVEDARRVFEVNVLGPFAVTQAFLPLLLEAASGSGGSNGGGGAVVANLGSINTILRPPFFSAYNASKAAVEVLGATMRTELAPLGVRVVTLKTGSVRTRLFGNAPAVPLPDGSLYAYYAPLRRWIEGRAMLEGAAYMDADEYARGVAGELLRPPSSWFAKRVVWQGGLTTVAWLLGCFGWDALLFHHSNAPKVDGQGTMYLWSFQRECWNAALLEIIFASIKRSESRGQPIYLNPRPVTRNDARQNLKAFSDDKGSLSETHPRPEHFEQFVADPAVEVNGCLGWMEFDKRTLFMALKTIQNHLWELLPSSSRLLAIVYPFLSGVNLEKEAMLSALNFDHVVGFCIVDVARRNWRGKGTLVDFGDLISPLETRIWWKRGTYGDWFRGHIVAQLEYEMSKGYDIDPPRPNY